MFDVEVEMRSGATKSGGIEDVAKVVARLEANRESECMKICCRWRDKALLIFCTLDRNASGNFFSQLFAE